MSKKSLLLRTIVASIVVFFVWSLLDMVIHQYLLRDAYEATAHLWRPEAEMKMTLISVVTFGYCACMAIIYAYMVAPKSLAAAIKFGFWFGLATAIVTGLAPHAYTPLPLNIALSWFVVTVIQAVVSGAIIGVIVKEPVAE